MRALVSGATGMVGAHICERLHADGWSLRALVRDPAAAAWLAGSDVECVRGDTLDATSYAAAARGCDAVFHAAAVITPSGGWEAFRRPNVDGTANAIAAARAAGARLLHVSSVAVYGAAARYTGALPVSEERADAPLGANEHYARSKRESERLVLDAHERGELWATAIRPCVVYGRHDRQFVPRIARLLRFGVAPLVGGGRSALPLVHAANVADAAVRAATTDVAGGRAFNTANDFPVTFAEFVRLAGEGMRRRIVPVPVPAALLSGGLALARLATRGRSGVMTMARASVDFLARDNPFTSQRAYEELGWRPTVRPEHGVPDAFAWNEERTRTGTAAGHVERARTRERVG